MKILKKISQYKEPIAIFPIGISGSGKSFIFNKTNFKSWQILSADTLRQDHLKKLRKKKKQIIANGRRRLADPNDPAHIFHPMLREWVFKQSQKQLHRIATQQKNCVLDLTNIHLQRVYFFNVLRKYNYTIVAVVFKPRPTKYHLKNVKKRSQKGGIDLSTKDSHFADEVRTQIIVDQKNCMRAFLKTLKKGRSQHERLPNVSQVHLKTTLPSFDKYLKSLSPRILKNVKKLSQFDRVDDILKI